MHWLTNIIITNQSVCRVQALIIERSTELERLRIQHQALLRSEAEQQDVIDQMVLRWDTLWQHVFVFCKILENCLCFCDITSTYLIKYFKHVNAFETEALA